MRKVKKKKSEIKKEFVQTQKKEPVKVKETIKAESVKEQLSVRVPNIHIGDKVIMTSQYDVPNEIKGVIWTVAEPPIFVNGKRMVRLEGYKKPYPVDGLKVVG